MASSLAMADAYPATRHARPVVITNHVPLARERPTCFRASALLLVVLVCLRTLRIINAQIASKLAIPAQEMARTNALHAFQANTSVNLSPV